MSNPIPLEDIQIGDFFISAPYKDQISGDLSHWIRRGDGEGGQFSAKLLGKCIAKFYENNF